MQNQVQNQQQHPISKSQQQPSTEAQQKQANSHPAPQDQDQRHTLSRSQPNQQLLEHESEVLDQSAHNQEYEGTNISKQRLIEEEAKQTILELQIKEQEMNLAHKKDKLRKTYIVTGILLAVTIFHIVSFRETEKERLIAIKDHDKSIDMLNQTGYFVGIEKLRKTTQIELRVQNLVDTLRENTITDKQKTSLFDIDKWRDQLTLNHYYYEVFSQILYLMLQNQNQYKFVLDLKCAPKQQKEVNRGIGQLCLGYQAKQHKTNLQDYQSKASIMRKIFINEEFQSYKQDLVDFFTRLELALKSLNNSQRVKILSSLKNLRAEIGLNE